MFYTDSHLSRDEHVNGTVDSLLLAAEGLGSEDSFAMAVRFLDPAEHLLQRDWWLGVLEALPPTHAQLSTQRRHAGAHFKNTLRRS